MIRILILGLALLGTLQLSGCKKIEGPGGSGSITGEVTVEHRMLGYVNGNLVLDSTITYAGLDEDVYIIYGDDGSYHDDDITTSIDGRFRFNYLEPGDYSIYVYEDCPYDVPNGQPQQGCDNVPVIVDVQIPGKGEQVDVGQITIHKTKRLY